MDKIFIVFGGTGFIGSDIVRQLREKGLKTYTFGRSDIGSSEHIVGDILNETDVNLAIAGKTHIINCIGLTPILKPKKISYQQAHVESVKNIIAAAKSTKITRLVHISASGADASSQSAYLRTKGEAESLIKGSKIPASIIRPSIVVGKGSEISEQFNKIRALKILPLPNFRKTVEPINIESLSKQLIDRALNSRSDFEIITPEAKSTSMGEFLRNTAKESGLYTLPIPESIVKPILHLIIWTKLTPLSPDILTLVS